MHNLLMKKIDHSGSCFHIFFNTAQHSIPYICLWVNEINKVSFQKSALIDCDFTYEERDLQSLELKWYFRHDPRPIYTWVPPALPQVDEAFKNHINANYEISSDPYKKHRALHLKDISTKLSGRYSCRVSSIHTDEFKSKDLIIYCKYM